VATITPQALATQIEGGHVPLVLDVRSQVEFNQGHVPGVIHIPFECSTSQGTWRNGEKQSS
jgi:rhodanese-related sulfurtransferase